MNNKYDVVIVGTGVAGCFTALNLPEETRILMITKAESEESDSFLAQGGICVLKDEEDFDSFLQDTLKAGHYQNKVESVETMIRKSGKVINQLIGYGVNFHKRDGKLCYTREGAHSTNRILYHGDNTGEEITSVLLEQVKKRKNIEIHTHKTMIDLIQKNNYCYGIIIMTEDGKCEAIWAGDVILACGGIGGIFENTTNYAHLTGDGVAIAIRHGIKVKDVNYIQIHPTTFYSEGKGRRFLISESVRGEGAKLYNKKGERFADELLPRDVLTNEIYKQMEKDKMPHVWLSMKEIRHVDIEERFPNIVKKCLEEGYDPKTELIPVVPAQHYLMGGVQIDQKGQTTMRHLYAAGETCYNGVHGANRLASNSLLESLVFAGEAAEAIRTSNGKDRSGDNEVYCRDWRALRNEFGICTEEYADMEKYWEECRKLIWNEIERERKHNESNFKKTECR